MFTLTLSKAAEGSSASPNITFVVSLFKFLVCLVRTSPILNTTGAEISILIKKNEGFGLYSKCSSNSTNKLSTNLVD